MNENSMVLAFPMILQGLIMLVDEFHFHRRRGLPIWEKAGHPLDSLTVFICFLFLIEAVPSTGNLWIFIGLASFSCVFVTKDEFVHSQECEPLENWLHSLLFILHPIIFTAAGMLWYFHQSLDLVKIQATLIFAFMIYQTLYWNVPWKKIQLKNK